MRKNQNTLGRSNTSNEMVASKMQWKSSADEEHVAAAAPEELARLLQDPVEHRGQVPRRERGEALGAEAQER